MTGPRLEVASLQSFLEAVVPDREPTVETVSLIKGGYSRETAMGVVRWGDGSSQRVVLRCDPDPARMVFESDRQREWEVLSALDSVETNFGVAPPLWFDATGEHFGTKCIVSGFYDGRSLEQAAAELSRQEVSDTFLDVVAAVHAAPLDGLLGETLGMPGSWDDALDALIDVLDFESRHGEDARPALRYAVARLRSFRPEPVELTLVHGDLQPGNVLLGDSGPVVIDWEFARIGDPREDIGYYSRHPTSVNLYLDNPEEYLARYREQSGMTEAQLNPETVDFFYLLGLAGPYRDEIRAADAIARGESRGIMAAYLTNAITNQYQLYADIARGLARAGTENR